MLQKRLYLVLFGCMIGMMNVTAQINVVNKTGGDIAGNRFLHYEFLSAQADTISVKVINPKGEIQAIPVRNRSLINATKLDFRFNTRFWAEGRYTILVENKEKVIARKRIYITLPEKKKN